MVIGSDKPSLKVSTAEVGEGQVIYLEDTTLESKDSEFSTIPFTRRQGRSFRSGTSLNLTEPDDDDDRVMVKGTGLKSCSLIIWSRDEWGRVEGSKYWAMHFTEYPSILKLLPVLLETGHWS